MVKERPRRFKYTWMRTAEDRAEDYSAFDGALIIGRVYRLKSTTAGGWWWGSQAALEWHGHRARRRDHPRRGVSRRRGRVRCAGCANRRGQVEGPALRWPEAPTEEKSPPASRPMWDAQIGRLDHRPRKGPAARVQGTATSRRRAPVRCGCVRRGTIFNPVDCIWFRLSDGYKRFFQRSRKPARNGAHRTLRAKSKQTWVFADDSRKWNAMGGNNDSTRGWGLAIGGAFAVKRMIDSR